MAVGTGNALDNVLIGNAQDNVLSGLGGNNMMTGGFGNDTYTVAGAGDVVVEAAGGSIDTIISSVNDTLAASVENLILIGRATNGSGNELANILTGNTLNNRLDGAAGADATAGDLGDDTYFVANAADQTVEYTGQGIDTVVVSVS